MTPIRLFKILGVGLTMAVMVRYAFVSYEVIRQDRLTAEACNFVGLPLETGALRDVYEGLLGALHRAGEAGACVSVVDNGRSFSPDCIQAGVSYHTALCKAESNTGVRAAISFEQPGLIGWNLSLLWLIFSALVFGGLYLSNLAVAFLTKAFSNEVQSLLHKESDSTAEIGRWTSWLLKKAGIAESLTKQAQHFRSQLSEYDLKAKTESMARQKLELEAKLSHEFAEKVRQIRHDIRSPLTSLQAVYERLESGDKSKKVLASAIRRTQLLIDDLDQVDKEIEPARLVIAEVVAKETLIMLTSKFTQTKSAFLTMEYDEGELSPIQVGVKGFRSAIENLLENALDAISVGGHVQLKILRERGQCKILIEDDGCGISPENMANLFSRGGTFGKLNGIGLGLYHTKNSVESWGGRIECERLPQGTRFVMSFPLIQTGVVFVGLPPKGRLKVIDDESLVPAALKNAGYEISEVAQTFQEGRELLAKGMAHGISVLVDYRLENENFGTDLIAEQPGRSQVLLCTNDYDQLPVIQKAKQIGVKILPKPLCFFADLAILEH